MITTIETDTSTVDIMDVYEREFGDLLYLRNKATVYQRFYNTTKKTMITKYKFLPKELIECRIQSLWKKLLARNPALRSRHESDVRAAKLLCSKKKSAKTRQRKEQKNARSSYKPLRRGSQKAESLTDSDEDDQGGLYHTPLPGFRSKRNNRRATEDRYMPLDIKVARHSQALPEECKRPTSSEHNGEEREHAEYLEEESSLTGHEATEINKSGASEEHHTTDDTTGCHEEVGNHEVLSTSKHLMTTHEPSFYTANTTEDKQNSLICKNALKTAAATELNQSDMAGIATLAHSGHTTTCAVTVDAKTSVNGPEHSQRQMDNSEQLQLDKIIKEKKPDTDLVAHMDKGAAQLRLHLHEDAGDSNDVSDHFATETTVTISSSASNEEERAGATFENSVGSKEGTLTQSNNLKQLETTTLPENAVQNKPITSHSEESCRYSTSHINEGVTTARLPTEWLKLQGCDKCEGKQLKDVKSKPIQDAIKQLKKGGIPVLITQPCDAATPRRPITTMLEHDNYEATEFNRLQKTSNSSAEVINEKPQNECVRISYDICKTDSKSAPLKSTKNIQPGNSDHKITKNKKHEEPKSSSNDTPTGHKQGRRAVGRDVVKTKLSLSYLTQTAKNKEKQPADVNNKGKKLKNNQGPASVLQHTAMSTANKSDAESGNDVQRNVVVVSSADEGHKICTKPFDDKYPADAGTKSDKLDPTSVLQHTTVLLSNKSDDETRNDAAAISRLNEGHKICKKLFIDERPADVGNKSDKLDNSHRPASVLQHTTASTANKSDDSQNDAQKNVTVVSSDYEGHKICKKPLTDKCPADVDNRSIKLKNGQRSASLLRHTTKPTSKKWDGKSGNDVQENAATVPEAHTGRNLHKKPPKQSEDIDKKDSNTKITVATKSTIQRDYAQNAAMTRHDIKKQQKEIHEKACGMQVDSKKESGRVIASKRCMESMSNARTDIMADSTACERQKKNNETAEKEEVGNNTKLGLVADSVPMETKAAKDSDMPGQEAISHPRQHTREGAMANPAALEKLSNAHKELQEDETSSDTNTKMVVSENFAEGSKEITKNATATSLENQCQRKLRGRTVTSCPTSKMKVSSAKATQEAEAMKCCDDAEAIPNEETSKHPCSPPREAVTHTESRDNVLAKESFKTPKSVKSAELPCPQTPLKRRSLRQKNLRMPVLRKGETGTALVDDQQNDPETPLGFRAKCMKQEAEKANEKRLQSWGQSIYNEHNQQIQEKSKAWTENGRENEKGHQSDQRSMKQQELSWSSNFCSDQPSTKQPVISTCVRDNDVQDKCQQPAVNLSSQDKGSSVYLAHLAQSMKGDATNDKQQQSDTNGDIEMSQIRSSEDLRGLTQYPTQNLERHKAVQNLSATTDMQEDSTSEMELDEDDDLPCLTQTLNRMQACSLYSRNEARAAVIATNTTGNVLGKEPNAESYLKDEKQVAERSNREITENGEQIKKHKKTKEVRNAGNINNPNVGTDLEASNDEHDSSILFNIDDDDEAAACDRSHSFFQMKLTPTPLNFLKSSGDRNDSDSAEELFPWLADKVEPETNKRKGKPLSQNAPHESGMNRPDFKRLRFQQEDSGRQRSNAKQFRPAKRVTIVDAAAQQTRETYGKRQHTFPISCYKQEHDGSDHSSVCAGLPPLLSRQEVEFFESDNDEDLGHDADDDYEV